MSDFANDGMKYGQNVTGQCRFLAPELNYTKDCSKYEGFGYVIQYNFTAVHAALLYEALANEALVRQATSAHDIFRRSSATFTVQATIAPLPITSIEEKMGAGEDAFAAWFLVSFFGLGLSVFRCWSDLSCANTIYHSGLVLMVKTGCF